MDVNADGRLDLIFPSAWADGHNPGKPLKARVYLARQGRHFEETGEHYGVWGVGSTSIAAGDLNLDGWPDLVVANSREKHDPQTDSFIFWGSRTGFRVDAPERLPTYGAQKAILSDLNRTAVRKSSSTDGVSFASIGIGRGVSQQLISG